MSHVKVSVHFLEGSVFVTEVATLAIGAEAFSVELSAVLRLIFVVVATLLLLIEVEVMLFAQLIHSMHTIKSCSSPQNILYTLFFCDRDIFSCRT